MTTEELDGATLANMHEGPDQASQRLAVPLRNHEERGEVARKPTDFAEGGQMALQPRTEAAGSAASSLVGGEATTANPKESPAHQPQGRMPAAGPHARSELID